MTNEVSINDFTQELQCPFKGENYSVRDNGAVLKHPRVDKRPRPTDNQWTFGKLIAKTGYLGIASVRIHSIVATAFHGIPPTKEHVVDHIDTNRQNNRPENLRWVTRLEHAILNPITAKRIATVCGSVEAFLADPSKFRDKFPEPNYSWMCTVSKQESQISLERMSSWAKSDKLPSGGSIGEWIFKRDTPPIIQSKLKSDVPELIMSKTSGAAQRNWKIPSEFPCCPMEFDGEPITAYARRLTLGALFSSNDVYSSTVLKSALSYDKQSLFVISESTEGKNATKPWGLAKITFEDDLFVHTSLSSFFSLEGAEKQFCLAQGIEWTGGDSIDDYL